MEIKTRKNLLNTYYYINAVSVKRKEDGALECEITERALRPIIEHYIMNKLNI